MFPTRAFGQPQSCRRIAIVAINVKVDRISSRHATVLHPSGLGQILTARGSWQGGPVPASKPSK